MKGSKSLQTVLTKTLIFQSYKYTVRLKPQLKDTERIEKVNLNGKAVRKQRGNAESGDDSQFLEFYMSDEFNTEAGM